MFKNWINFVHNGLMQSVQCSSFGIKICKSRLRRMSSFTNSLKVIKPPERIPVYRVINTNGQLENSAELASIEKQLVLNIYKFMTTLKEMDKILYECQRQGRISFYLTSLGEEAVQIGSAAGFQSDDLIFPQYRESGVLLWRGFTIQEFIHQCFGNVKDYGKGKQMPVHYASKKHHYMSVSSPLATQMPQAVGAAYAHKLSNNRRCVLTYFGDGAASEGDAHAAFNFAATLECPIIFLCRNNGYAISTPVSEQYKGDGISGRALGYGIPALRVDGNDALAVYNATKLARSYVIENNKPIILEAFTYRLGHHSTSDDSTIYRSKDELNEQERKNSIARLRNFLEIHEWWNDEMENNLISDIKKEVFNAIKNAEKLKKSKWQEMFFDVYDELPPHLVEQMGYMEKHLQKYGQYYPMENFESS